MEGAVGREEFMRAGRLQALGRALLFVVLFFALLATAVLLVPGLGEAEVPAGDGLPLSLLGQFAVALAAALIAAWAVGAAVERDGAAGFGFPLTRRAGVQMVGGIGLGLVAMLGVIGALALTGVFRFEAEAGTTAGWFAVVVTSLAAFAIPAAAEEAVFRGYLFRNLIEATGTIPAVLATSLLFAVVHGGNPEIGGFAFANIFLAGVLLAVAVLRTGSLWLATGVHLGWNWAMAGPLDLPVSGLDAYDTPLYDAIPSTPGWLSGGLFGPEGGLAGTVAALAALGLIVWMTRPESPMGPAAAE